MQYIINYNLSVNQYDYYLDIKIRLFYTRSLELLEIPVRLFYVVYDLLVIVFVGRLIFKYFYRYATVRVEMRKDYTPISLYIV